MGDLLRKDEKDFELYGRVPFTRAEVSMGVGINERLRLCTRALMMYSVCPCGRSTPTLTCAFGTGSGGEKLFGTCLGRAEKVGGCLCPEDVPKLSMEVLTGVFGTEPWCVAPCRTVESGVPI